MLGSVVESHSAMADKKVARLLTQPIYTSKSSAKDLPRRALKLLLGFHIGFHLGRGGRKGCCSYSRMRSTQGQKKKHGRQDLEGALGVDRHAAHMFVLPT